MELELKKERFLITGGYGFIGSWLIRELMNDDFVEICNIDKLSYSSNTKSFDTSSAKNYQFKKIDIADAKSINKAVIEFKPDYIINLTALPLAVTAVKNAEEAFKSILNSTHNFMEILRDINFEDEEIIDCLLCEKHDQRV